MRDSRREVARFDGVIVLSLLATGLTHRSVSSYVTVSDLLFGCAIGVAAFRLMASGARIVVPAWIVPMLLLVMWAAAGATVFLFGYAPPLGAFVASEVGRSLFGVVFYVGGTVVLWSYGRRIGVQTILRSVVLIGLLSVGAAALLYAASRTMPSLDPYIKWLAGSRSGVEARYVSGSSVLRPTGFFAEPALFGAFQAFSLGVLLLARQRGCRVSRPALIVLGLSVVVSYSPGAYLIALAGIGAGMVRIGKGSSLARVHPLRRRPSRALLALSAIVAVGGILPSIWDGIDLAIVERSKRAIAGQDVSANARTTTSWEAPLRIVRSSPVVGVGLGNLAPTVEELSIELKNWRDLEGAGDGWNGFAWALGSMGLVGMLLLVAFVGKVGTRISFIAAAQLTAFWMASSWMLMPLPWVFVFISASLVAAVGRNQEAAAK